jgi:hypothetical protein
MVKGIKILLAGYGPTWTEYICTAIKQEINVNFMQQGQKKTISEGKGGWRQK